ncbi:questin oxidase family protein [Streptomyces sp. SPB074]|uniref:questin oxidase family protein n=1 Tax=Streptomyces sp. (strain SPB074) TaxID=465543 RepID=UPI00017F19A5|nr:questin oxidase family protein [Streptomyces sp. SPB074]
MLDEALERLHSTGPERNGRLSNHAPMAVEALVRGGHGGAVHRWVDRYRDKLEQAPSSYARVTEENWREALGDPRRIADWTAYFGVRLTEAPWRAVLATWWPRLLPGIVAGATHPVIRTGHAVRTLLATEAGARGAEESARPREPDGPRLAELAHALGYWAARSQPLPAVRALGAYGSADAALDAVPAVAEQRGGIRERLSCLDAFPVWPATEVGGPREAAERLRELVAAAVRRYATHAHGDPVMLVHAATAPNAVLRVLPALPSGLWAPSLSAAWRASAAVTAAYAPARAASPKHLEAEAEALDAAEVFARAAAHGDEHAVKFADTALDPALNLTDPLTRAAALRAVELIDPLW